MWSWCVFIVFSSLCIGCSLKYLQNSIQKRGEVLRYESKLFIRIEPNQIFRCRRCVWIPPTWISIHFGTLQMMNSRSLGVYLNNWFGVWHLLYCISHRCNWYLFIGFPPNAPFKWLLMHLELIHYFAIFVVTSLIVFVFVCIFIPLSKFECWTVYLIFCMFNLDAALKHDLIHCCSIYAASDCNANEITNWMQWRDIFI